MKLSLRIGGSLAAFGFLTMFACAAYADDDTAATTPGISGSPLTQNAVTSFENQYNVPLMMSTNALSARSIDSAPPTPRLRDIQQLAANSGLTWRKIYEITPAGDGAPVTTEAMAAQMVDQTGLVTLGSTALPANAAISAIARADRASARFSGTQFVSDINLNLNNVSIADAIAAAAQRTHTHWKSVYVLAPVADGRSASGEARVATVPPTMSYQQYEATQMFNGPTTIHFIPVDQQIKQPNAAIDAAAKANAAANPNGFGNTNAVGAAGAYPDVNSNFGTYPFVMNNGYAYNQLGQPYPTSSYPAPAPYNNGTIVFGGTTTNSESF